MKHLLNQIGILAISLLFATTSCSNSTSSTSETETTSEETTVVPEIKNAEPAPTPAAANDKIFLIKTTAGDIKVKIYKECPLHLANFSKLVAEKFYDGVLFHRVIKGFMIQTGDPESKKAEPGMGYGSGGPGYTIPAEILPAFYHKKGALAAARTGEGNPYKASSGSQFYIVQGRVMPKEQLIQQMGNRFSPQALNDYATIGGTPELDGEYTVFGETISGIETVDKIANTVTLQNPQDRPKADIKIISVTEETK